MGSAFIYGIRKRELKMRKFRSYRSTSSYRSYNRHEWIFLNKFRVFQNGVKIGTVGGRDEVEAMGRIPAHILDKGPITLEKMYCEV